MSLRNLTLTDALTEARRRFVDARPKTQEFHSKATTFAPGGNTRTVLYHGPFPIRIVRGEGAFIEDLDGFRYLDLLGEYTAGAFGHSHPAILDAVRAGLKDGLSFGAHNLAEAQLAEILVQRFPALEQVRFTNSGTEANLMAVSTARYCTGRSRVMVFNGGYHGGVLSFAHGNAPINAPFPFVIGTYNDIEATRAVLAADGSDIACVLVEPMQGAAGCLPADAEFLRMLRAETEKSGSLLIFDEVMTSRFQTGGAHAMLGIRPDMITLGKWLGGGLSFGAFGGRAELMEPYDPSRANHLAHAGTFNNNVLSMRAGIAALTEAFTPSIAEDLHRSGDALRDRINGLFSDRGLALQATGVGSLMTIHAIAGSLRNSADLDSADDAVMELLFLELLARGYYIARRGFIALSTAVTDKDLDGFVAALEEILAVAPLR